MKSFLLGLLTLASLSPAFAGTGTETTFAGGSLEARIEELQKKNFRSEKTELYEGPGEDFTVRYPFGNLSLDDKVLLLSINLEVEERGYTFNLDWLKEQLKMEGANYEGVRTTYFEFMPAVVAQLAKLDPVGFVGIPGLWEDNASATRKAVSSDQLVKTAEAYLKTIEGLPSDEQALRIIELVKGTALYRSFYRGDIHVHRSVLNAIDRHIQKQGISNQRAFFVYAAILSFHANNPKYTNNAWIRETPEYQSVKADVLASLIRLRFTPKLIKAAFKVLDQDPVQHLSVGHWIALAFGGYSGQRPPSELAAYLAAMKGFVQTEYAKPTDCNAYLRARVWLKQQKIFGTVAGH